MIDRKKKIRIIQIILVAFCFIFFTFTYNKDNKDINKKVISKKFKSQIENNLAKNIKETDSNIFYNVEYSGVDLSGNRYVIKSEEALTNKSENNLVNMRYVKATFYFKDNTTLFVNSNNAVYNNKTLDVKFFDDVNAKYNESELFAKEVEYSNSKNLIVIKDNVRINDKNSNMFADQLLFNIKNQSLNITSFKDSKISANIDLNEKSF
tara:strand:- start:4558 stop:5181 length:624 start_codon:yes stop_codon:yes gene_type:complete